MYVLKLFRSGSWWRIAVMDVDPGQYVEGLIDRPGVRRIWVSRPVRANTPQYGAAHEKAKALLEAGNPQAAVRAAIDRLCQRHWPRITNVVVLRGPREEGR